MILHNCLIVVLPEGRCESNSCMDQMVHCTVLGSVPPEMDEFVRALAEKHPGAGVYLPLPKITMKEPDR